MNVKFKSMQRHFTFYICCFAFYISESLVNY